MIQRGLFIVQHLHAVFRGVLDRAAQPGQPGLRQQHQGRAHQAQLVVAAADGQADHAGGPQAGGGGQALDGHALGDDDGARADEAQAGDYLPADAGDIRGQLHIKVDVQAGQRRQRRRQAHQRMGAKTGGAVLGRALQADQRAAQAGHQRLDRHGPQAQRPYAVKNGKQGTPSVLL